MIRGLYIDITLKPSGLRTWRLFYCLFAGPLYFQPLIFFITGSVYIIVCFYLLAFIYKLISFLYIFLFAAAGDSAVFFVYPFRILLYFSISAPLVFVVAACFIASILCIGLFFPTLAACLPSSAEPLQLFQSFACLRSLP